MSLKYVTKKLEGQSLEEGEAVNSQKVGIHEIFLWYLHCQLHSRSAILNPCTKESQKIVLFQPYVEYFNLISMKLGQEWTSWSLDTIQNESQLKIWHKKGQKKVKL